MANNIFEFVFKSRGAANLVKRTHQVFSRFGVNPNRMGRRFDRFMDVLDTFGCRPTFPVTALPLGRHPEFGRRLIERGAELAVHAYTHIDLTSLDLATQTDHIGRAIEIFRREGVPFSGFRAPYLHWNEDTMAVVETYQFKYSSNQTVLWDVIDIENLSAEQSLGWEKSRAFYQPLPAGEVAVLPSRKRGFIEIPVSLPDDETLVDRMYFRDPDYLLKAWQAVLELTYSRGELFTLQLHPERVGFFSQPLSELLTLCRNKKPGVWLASLEEIADWWIAKTQNGAEFIRENNGIKVVIKACPGAVVYLRSRSGEQTIPPGVIRLEETRRPCIGISPGSDRRIIDLLKEKGYLLEVGEPSEDVAFHLGKLEYTGYVGVYKLLERIHGFEGPLLRFGTWPHGNRCALAVTGDIDALTIWDFINRLRGA